MLLSERVHVVELIKPQTAAGARSADWISLKHYEGIMMIISAGQNGAGTFNITVDKAKTAAGGSNSDGITCYHVASLEDFTPGTDADAWVKVTAAATFASSNTGSDSSHYIIDIKADELGEGYDFVQLELSSAGQAANFLSAVGILYGGIAAKPANQQTGVA